MASIHALVIFCACTCWKVLHQFLRPRVVVDLRMRIYPSLSAIHQSLKLSRIGMNLEIGSLFRDAAD